ncbi:MAG: hypothetical protein P1P85_02505 [Patescibacteria group bacterium]|nr:hypothetical protein [Patescibacteria group bacterium]
MNKKIILPVIGFIMLIGSILMATYFKKVERDLTQKRNQTQNQTIDQKNNIPKEGTTETERENDINTEKLDTLEKDITELENLTNNPILESIDSDLGGF